MKGSFSLPVFVLFVGICAASMAEVLWKITFAEIEFSIELCSYNYFIQGDINENI